MSTWSGAFAACPLVAILRGVTPEEVTGIGRALLESGFSIIEVPLNSPRPFESIGRLSREFTGNALIGAGTVTDPAEVLAVQAAGGQVIISPHADAQIVEATKSLGLVSVPGISTPTEAFRMRAAGADALKLFPAEAHPPRVLRALRAVLPSDLPILPVGSITTENMLDYWQAGAAGFGLGSALYKPGATAEQVRVAAEGFISALRRLPRTHTAGG